MIFQPIYYYLSLPDKGIYKIPSSISNLDSLETLYLNNNNITTLDPSICNINDFCEIFIQNNNLCEEYQFECLDHWDPQDCDE